MARQGVIAYTVSAWCNSAFALTRIVRVMLRVKTAMIRFEVMFVFFLLCMGHICCYRTFILLHILRGVIHGILQV